MKDELAKHIADHICDPIDGPFEGEDFWVEDDKVYVANIYLSAKILRAVNTSGLYSKRLVKYEKSGDVVVLGFDTTADDTPVFSRKIGKDKKTIATVKITETKRFCIYLDGERTAADHKTISAAKKFLTTMHKTMLEK